MAKRISIINFKGGVGKTTLAFHLGAGLAKFHNARVLLIDVDHQSSLSIAASHGYIIPVVPVYDRSSTQNVGGRGIHIQFEKLTAELKKRVDSL